MGVGLAFRKREHSELELDLLKRICTQTHRRSDLLSPLALRAGGEKNHWESPKSPPMWPSATLWWLKATSPSSCQQTMFLQVQF